MEYILKIWYRTKDQIKVIRIKVSEEEILTGTLKYKVPGKILNVEFE